LKLWLTASRRRRTVRRQYLKMSSPGPRRLFVSIFFLVIVLLSFGFLFQEMRGCGSQVASLMGPLETALSESENIKNIIPNLPTVRLARPGSVSVRPRFGSGFWAPGSPAFFHAVVGSPSIFVWRRIYKFLCKLHATDHWGPLLFYFF